MSGVVQIASGVDAGAAILEAIFDHTDLMIAYLDAELRFVRVNRAYAAADGRVPADFVGKSHFALYPNEENERIFRRVVQTGVAHVERAKPFQYAHAPERGVTYWDWSLVPLTSGPRAGGVVLSLLDVTDRIRAMESLQRSLEEKEVLLREVHHRVKNNLQVISSLLYLQRTKIGDHPSAQRAFDESRNRILAMASIHERLYASGDVTQVDMASYVAGLAKSLAASYLVDESAIAIEVDVVPVSLAVDVAVPCGLVLNELISNAIEHAFPDGRAGRVRVSAQRREGRVVLAVEDDGVGLPDPMRPNLGLRMVESLSREMGATLEIERHPGTRIRLALR